MRDIIFWSRRTISCCNIIWHRYSRNIFDWNLYRRLKGHFILLLLPSSKTLATSVGVTLASCGLLSIPVGADVGTVRLEVNDTVVGIAASEATGLAFVGWG